MRRNLFIIALVSLLLAFSSTAFSRVKHHVQHGYHPPQQINPPNERVIIVDPRVHVWSAYEYDGTLIRFGTATAGNSWCRDIRRSCRTKTGHFRIYSLGDRSCKSHKFPLPRGGAPMPYCMFFNGGQALHGSYQVVKANVSHGCIRLHVEDAKWLRHEFVEGPNSYNGYRGTRVIIKPYY